MNELSRTLISTGELAASIDDPALVVVDCRYDLIDLDGGERAYRASHIPGARFMHLERDLSGQKNGRNGRHPLPAIPALASTFGRAGIDASKQVVAYDQNTGTGAARLWWLLQWLGHEAVAVLDGGFDKWLREGEPTTQDVPVARPAVFIPKVPRPTASADELLRQLDDGTLLVVDARSPERFRGDTEPIDPVAGHIPGAVNRPFTANLTTEGTFKPAALLRSEFSTLLDEKPPAAVVHQCGSGVTAAHNLLAMTIAGLTGSRLYPGSWSEWCADPRRPVARG